MFGKFVSARSAAAVMGKYVGQRELDIQSNFGLEICDIMQQSSILLQATLKLIITVSMQI